MNVNHTSNGPVIDWEGRAKKAEAEVERLRRWKAEASPLLGEWEKVWEALGCPGDIGSHKTEISLLEVLRLRAELDHQQGRADELQRKLDFRINQYNALEREVEQEVNNAYNSGLEDGRDYA